MRQNELTELEDKLEPLFTAEPLVGLVYLFGSRAQGTAGERSDYDLAIFFTEADVVKRHEKLFRLASDISKTVGSDRIDVHCLNDLKAPELKYHIIHDGELIFEREPHRLVIEPRILNEYFDFTYLLRKYGLTQTV